MVMMSERSSLLKCPSCTMTLIMVSPLSPSFSPTFPSPHTSDAMLHARKWLRFSLRFVQKRKERIEVNPLAVGLTRMPMIHSYLQVIAARRAAGGGDDRTDILQVMSGSKAGPSDIVQVQALNPFFLSCPGHNRCSWILSTRMVLGSPMMKSLASLSLCFLLASILPPSHHHGFPFTCPTTSES